MTHDLMFSRSDDPLSPSTMPAPVYDQAFALLEQSFKDRHFLQAYRSLPSRVATANADSPTHSDISEDDDDDDDDSDDSASMHEGYGNHNLTHITLMRSNTTLPPTPPALQPDGDSLRPQLLPLPKSSSRLSTPINQQGPPTPDLTPPNTRPKDLAAIHRPSLLHYPSSRAESFFTARESQSRASAHGQLNDSKSSLALGSDAANTWLGATMYMPMGGLQWDQGNNSTQLWEGIESGETTPTQEVQSDFPHPNAAFEKSLSQTPNRVASPEFANPDFLKNVTVRKKRARKLHPHTSDDHEDSSDYHVRSQPRHVSQPADSNGTPSTTKNDEKFDWPEVANDHLYKRMRDEKSKRLSGASTTSTVVEAIVLPHPLERQRQPTLRRISGQRSLRDDASSKRSSLESTATSQHILKHKKSPLPGRAYLLEDTSRAISNPEAGRHRDTQHFEKSRKMQDSQDSRSFTVPEKHLHHAKPHAGLVQDDQHVKNQSENIEARVAAAHKQSWLDDASPEVDQARSRSKLRHVSAPIYSNRHSINGSPRDVYRRFDGADTKSQLDTRQGWKRHSIDADLESPDLERSSKPFGSSNQVSSKFGHRRSSSLKRDDSSTNVLFEPKSPTRTSSEWKDSRQLHPVLTPVSISQMSDRTTEITEATAVNLYPHGNKSLVVVQNGDKAGPPRPQASNIDEIFTPESDQEQAEQFLTNPVFHAFVSPPDVLPSVEEPDRLDIDSPLRNPRQAPQPPRLPIINFISATPVPEDEETTVKNAAQERPSAPRRPSLVEQVRRYSENLIQPFLARSSSHRSTSSQRPQTASDRDVTLHPFWRPRGFWDDFESDEDYDDFDDEGLPPGGDTSSVHTIDSSANKRQSWLWSPRRLSVRMRGFRGSGGFMLGNSLGIDRHGTNNRRPYITLPSLRKTNKDGDDKDMTGTSYNNDTRPSQQSFLRIVPTLRRRKSTDLLRKAAQSTESLRRLRRRRKLREWDLRYGVSAVRNKVRLRQERREEERRKEYREEIKKRIGMPVYVGGGNGWE